MDRQAKARVRIRQLARCWELRRGHLDLAGVHAVTDKVWCLIIEQSPEVRIIVFIHESLVPAEC